MSKWLFVSYFYTKGTEQGWGCCTINISAIDESEDINILSDLIAQEKKFNTVVPLYFRRLESPE